MKIAGIICEYNPLHKGHLHQIEQTKRLTGCDAVMCIMSGNFSQRAETCIMDKYERAKVAIEMGADIVVNIPTAYASNNAEVFALASVKIANSFKNLEFLSFGMEQPNLEVVNETADFLLNEPIEYKILLKEFLNKGYSFNESRISAVKKLIKQNKLNIKHKKEFLSLLTKPNNILAVEYVKALKQLNSHIKPVAVKRVGSEYNQQKMEGNLSSASAIRTKIYETNNVESVKEALPQKSYEALKNYVQNNGLVNQNKLHELAIYKLRTSSHAELKSLYNVNEGLENRLKTIATTTNTSTEFVNALQTKRYKASRLNSIVLNSVLNIKESTVKHIYKINKLPYIKVLAINSKNKELLKHLQCTSKLILRRQNTEKLRQTKFVKELIQLENNSNNLYNLLLRKNLLKPNDLFTVVKQVKGDNYEI